MDKDSFLDIDNDTKSGKGPGSIISGQFNYVTIYVVVLARPEMLRVCVKLRNGLPDHVYEVLIQLFEVDTVVSKHYAATYVRQLAIHADLVCRTLVDGLSPPSNFIERCQQLQSMKRYLIVKKKIIVKIK